MNTANENQKERKTKSMKLIKIVNSKTLLTPYCGPKKKATWCFLDSEECNIHK